jgi:hypothetical protein
MLTTWFAAVGIEDMCPELEKWLATHHDFGNTAPLKPMVDVDSAYCGSGLQIPWDEVGLSIEDAADEKLLVDALATMDDAKVDNASTGSVFVDAPSLHNLLDGESSNMNMSLMAVDRPFDEFATTDEEKVGFVPVDSASGDPSCSVTPFALMADETFDALPTLEAHYASASTVSTDVSPSLILREEKKLKRSFPGGDQTDGLLPLQAKRARLIKKPRKLEAAENWERHFEECISYFKNNACKSVPQKRPKPGKGGIGWNSSLAAWFMKQRSQKKDGRLTEERIRRLELIGFEWGRTKDVFESNYQTLTEFYNIVGHSNYPTTPCERSVVELQADRALRGGVRRVIDIGSRVRLEKLLLVKRMPRWITSLRDDFKDWQQLKAADPTIGTGPNDDKREKGYRQWKGREERLDKLSFDYYRQHRVKSGVRKGTKAKRFGDGCP